MAPKGSAVWGTGFEARDPAGASTITHILNNSSGGSSLPTRTETSPLTGTASLLFDKPSPTALDSSSNYYVSFTAKPGLSTTFRVNFTTLPATNGNGAGIASYSIDEEAIGVYRTGGSSYMALFTSAGSKVAWYGNVALSAGTTYLMTYTLRLAESGRLYPAMAILRNSSGVELERSPWVQVETSAVAVPFNILAIGSVAGTSAWTEAFGYKMDDVLCVAGGAHAPKSVKAYYLVPNAEGTLSRKKTATAAAGSNSTTIVTTGVDSTYVNHYVYVTAMASNYNARISSVTGTTTLNLASALGAPTDPTGMTFEVYGWGADTGNDGLRWNEVEEVPADDATTTLHAIGSGSGAAGRNVGFKHAGLAAAGGPSTLATNEKLYVQPWARVIGTTGGTGSSVFTNRWWDNSTTGDIGATVTTSWGWAPTAASGSRVPQMFRPGGTGLEWTLAAVDALEFGMFSTSSSSTNERLMSHCALEVFHVQEWDDVYGGVTMREPSIVAAHDITGISAHATAPVITTEYSHGLPGTGDQLMFVNTNSTPVIDRIFQVASVPSATTFTIAEIGGGAVTTTGAGTAGQILRAYYNIIACSSSNSISPTFFTYLQVSGRHGLPRSECGVATSGAASSITDTAKTWVVNEWTGFEVEIIKGTGLGQTRYISSNTATALTVSSNWTTTPDTTSVYMLGSRAVDLLGTNTTPVVDGKVYPITQDSGTASSGSATTLVDSGRTWVGDGWNGGMIILVSGTGSPATVAVTDTASDTITVASWPVATPDSTTVYRLHSAPNTFLFSPIAQITVSGAAGTVRIRRPNPIVIGVQ